MNLYALGINNDGHDNCDYDLILHVSDELVNLRKKMYFFWGGWAKEYIF